MSAVILSAVRTPIGSFGGGLTPFSAPQLGSIVIEEALRRAGVEPHVVGEVIMGNVLTAGAGQAPARQAALGARIPDSVPCLTINKVCGSGMKAVMLGDQAIRAGDVEVMVAGGQESMSNTPYLLEKGRFGYYLGNGRIIDSMMHDGLTDAYQNAAMGVAADECAVACNVSREVQDQFAVESYQRAQEATREGRFADEIVPVHVVGRERTDTIIRDDEEPFRTDFDKIPRLKPVFGEEGTVTAANASTINDGACALVIAARPFAERHGLNPVATIVAQASHSQKPMEFTTAPIEAVHKVLEKSGSTMGDIDLFEINEAFAVVALAARDRLGIPGDKMNVNGGAVALGHPIGASGARILTTLIHALHQRNLKRGLAAICIGGGEATAMVIETV